MAAYADLIKNARRPAKRRCGCLFSAHVCPNGSSKRGDPYVAGGPSAPPPSRRRRAWTETAGGRFQSRVGPLKWVGPATDDEIKAAGREGIGLAVVPIAFVSEHSETLVELDIEYRKLADEAGVTIPARAFRRGHAFGVHRGFA